MQNKVNFATLSIPIAIVMLIAWAIATFGYEAPGWVHAFLTAGVFLLIYGVVARGTPPAASDSARRQR
jgi:uncharacterized membrane protein